MQLIKGRVAEDKVTKCWKSDGGLYEGAKLRRGGIPKVWIGSAADIERIGRSVEGMGRGL